MKLSLRGKLIAGFLAASAFSLLIGIVSLTILSSSQTTNKDLAENYIPSIDTIWKASEAFTRAGKFSRIIGDASLTAGQLSRSIEDYKAAINDLETSMAAYVPLATTNEEKALLEKYKQAYSSWQSKHALYSDMWSEKKSELESGLRTKDRNAYEEMNDMMVLKSVDAREAYDALDAVFDEMVLLNRNLADKISNQAEQANKNAMWFMIGSIVVGVLTSVALGIFIANSTLRVLGTDPAELRDIVTQVTSGDTSMQLRSEINFGIYNDLRMMVSGLNDKVTSAELIAKGDLTTDVKLMSDKDRLGKAFQNMISVLRDIINRANSASQLVASGSSQVSGASQSLSQGATEQASSVEEISSSVTEISSKIKANASNASNASDIAAKAQSAAEQGNRQIKVTLDAMNDINSSSQEISKIIKVIDDIAFQTNLLALNAAVEAARAGRHGKGFAVVADEVRNLAGRSAKAAKETTELIESSSKKVDAGLSEAHRTAESFQEIMKNSIRVSEIISQIADASNDQASGISQIASGVNQINKVTQQTTANAEETAAAAEELASQAEELKRSLAYFHLGRAALSQHDSMPSHQSSKRVVAIRSSQTQDGWGSGPSQTRDSHGHDDQSYALDDKDFGKYGT